MEKYKTITEKYHYLEVGEKNLGKNIKRFLKYYYPNTKFSVRKLESFFYNVEFEDNNLCKIEVQNRIKIFENTNSKFNELFGGIKFVNVYQKFDIETRMDKHKEVIQDYPEMKDNKVVFNLCLLEKDKNYKSTMGTARLLTAFRLENNL